MRQRAALLVCGDKGDGLRTTRVPLRTCTESRSLEAKGEAERKGGKAMWRCRGSGSRLTRVGAPALQHTVVVRRD
ncbi:hypothetical protein O3P69_001688 [Scylla paramamosain]|uniref:Uncharacterized protein n=1 Tax=Scylla paramamosain TaxID=85552 RepID=A0AAW0UZ34_SCYPA